MDYRDTVHLPKTDFPMRAALSEREPAQVKAWQDERNERAVEIDWQFTTADARIRLRHLYPQIQPR